MEELGSVAEAYHADAPPQQQEMVRALFEAMDVNRNGSITQLEFTNYMIRSYPKVYRPELFVELDRDGNGCLSFKEVITLWFMLNVRNFCDGKGCRRILTTTFYVCPSCFHDLSKRRWFALCVDCYTKKNHGHEHKEFLDHYCMLSDAWWELREKVGVSKISDGEQIFSVQYTPQVHREGNVSRKCKLTNWQKKIVAEGILESMDPKIFVHHVPLGVDNWKVRVDIALDPKAVLWRPTSEMSNIEHAVGNTVAWHKDFIFFE